MNFNNFKNYFSSLVNLFPHGKKGMEMWEIIALVLAAFLLLFFLFWFSDLDQKLWKFLSTLGDLF